MFTGLIEEIGTITRLANKNNSMQLSISAHYILSDLRIGDSVAVNGVCLTVTYFDNNSFTVDIMPETFKTTSLSLLKTGSEVNLERALLVTGRVGGHFVTGHVDGIGKIIQITPIEDTLRYLICIDLELVKYCIDKGSIAIDGTSLTIFGIDCDKIMLALIPHTVKHSIIARKKVGDIVNIECDVLGKYVYKLIENNKVDKPSITVDMLLANGF